MLRAFDEKGGVGVYTRMLLQKLLQLDRKNTYLLFFQKSEDTHHFRDFKNVEQYHLPSIGKFFWDQVSVPYFAWKYKADLIFNTKFSIPLISSKKRIVVQHGADWFLPEFSGFYKKSDVIYNRIFIPLYCKKADKVISVSQFATEDFINYVKVPPHKMQTVYFGPADFFKKITDDTILSSIKRKYSLPDKFIFTLSRYGFGGGNRKNIKTTLLAYKHYYENTSNPVKLVIGGKNVDKYITDYNLSGEAFLNNVLFTGWIEQEDLPSIYSLAAIYLYPSNLETFPIPLTEAMACGTPIITSDANGLKEIAGDAALFVDNKDPEKISSAIRTLLSDDNLQKILSEKGLKRSKSFTWNKCAGEILDLFKKFETSSVINPPKKHDVLIESKQ